MTKPAVVALLAACIAQGVHSFATGVGGSTSFTSTSNTGLHRCGSLRQGGGAVGGRVSHHRVWAVRGGCLPNITGRQLHMQAGANAEAGSPGSSTAEDAKKGVVVIGGGPAGLASAMMLARRGWKDITVLEKGASSDYYEPDRAFVYQVDGRGQKFTDMVGVTEDVAAKSVPNTLFLLRKVAPEGVGDPIKLPIVDPTRKTAYWIPRHMFTRVLISYIAKNYGEINVLYGVEFIDLRKDSSGGLTVIAKQPKDESSSSGKTKEGAGTPTTPGAPSGWQYLTSLELNPRLVIGADGVTSKVRETLRKWEAEKLPEEMQGGRKGKSVANRFSLKKVKTGSSGLLYKIIPLQPNFPLDRSGKVLAKPEMAYIITSAQKDPKKRVRLGILPSSDPDGLRSMNVICPPEHPVFGFKTGEEFSAFLKESFPQVPTERLVPPKEAERFVTTKKSRFIEPQCCTGMHYLITSQQQQSEGAQPATAAQAGVAILGDAVHAFPPDLGQGVNSALEDVVVLERCLEESGDDLSVALPCFENRRKADSLAILELLRLGYPWQYGQAPLKSRIWGAHFALRLLLAKLAPAIFSPQIFMLIQKEKLSYSKILAMAHGSTRNLFFIIALIAGTICWRTGGVVAGAVGTIAGIGAAVNEVRRRSVALSPAW